MASFYLDVDTQQSLLAFQLLCLPHIRDTISRPRCGTPPRLGDLSLSISSVLVSRHTDSLQRPAQRSAVPVGGQDVFCCEGKPNEDVDINGAFGPAGVPQNAVLTHLAAFRHDRLCHILHLCVRSPTIDPTIGCCDFLIDARFDITGGTFMVSYGAWK